MVSEEKKIDRSTALVLRLFAAGLFATLARTVALFLLSHSLPGPVRVSVARGLYCDRDPLVFLHPLFMNDTVFAIIYGAFFMPGAYLLFRSYFRFRSALNGIVFGAGLWLISELVLLPLSLIEGSEPEFPSRGLIFVGNLVALEIYGACLALGIDGIDPRRYKRSSSE